MAEPRRLGSMLETARDLPPPPTSSTPGSDLPPAKVSGVPLRRWQSDTFAAFDLAKNPGMQAAYDRCRDVVEGRAWCALLAGPPGTGKTHLAIATMHDYPDGRAYFWKTADLLEWLRQLAYGQSLGVLGTLKSYVEQDFLLVLDDLGVEKDMIRFDDFGG